MTINTRRDLERYFNRYLYPNSFIKPINTQFASRYGEINSHNIDRLLYALGVRHNDRTNKFSVDDVYRMMTEHPDIVGEKIRNINNVNEHISQNTKMKITESQFYKLFEGVEWTNNGNIPNLRINSSNKDSDNLGAMSVDTRMFGDRYNILYGDGTSSHGVKSLNSIKKSKDAALVTYLNLIDFINHGHRGEIFTDKNLDGRTESAINKMLKNLSDDDIISKAKSAIERLKNSSQVATNLYDRVNSYAIAGKGEKIPKYNILQVPNTNVKCISLFTMTDFNFSDGLKNGNIRKSDKTDKKLRIGDDSSDEKVMPITYDDNIQPNIAQNFSLRGFDIDNYDINNLDHLKQNYQYQGGKYNTSEFGYDDLERELRKEKKYTSINQFLDKSVMYANYALKNENFIPDYIITAPSSSKFNKYFAINLSNKVGCKYIKDFFRQNLINVKWNGDNVYDTMLQNGFTQQEILNFEVQVRNVAYHEISYEIENKIDEFMTPYYDILSNISIKSNSRDKFSLEDSMKCIYRYSFLSLRFEKIYGEDVSKHLIDTFINQKIQYVDTHLFKSIVSLILLKIGKKKFNSMLNSVVPIIQKYSEMLEKNGYKLRFGLKRFKITNFYKKFRPYLKDVYVVADGFLNPETKMLVNSLQNGKVLIFDEDINSGATLKLCIDAYLEKIPKGDTKNLCCLTNAYSDSGI